MIDITELAQRVERIISDVKLKHGGNDTYAPIMKWDEFLALVEALEKAQQRIAELESRTVKLPLPSCTYADHSYPAYTKQQVLTMLESLGVTVVEGDV
ncbi:hypothetical protein [Klebsiella pneumoniae]|nr:hypothetical protein [Klebsiella pneumoniae]HCJ3657266.1 hypothetical protein [Klebsiella pneumoniae]HDK6141319.1 hypothetical protein [Klebsiella pneumoniae]HEL6464411.1 hypothetical protein [Klebsiella pneumoniae]